MSFKICRRSGKIGYRSPSEAQAAIDLIRERDSLRRQYDKRETSIYKCPRCPRWHLTSQSLTGSQGANRADPT